jgi:hypothetical protein
LIQARVPGLQTSGTGRTLSRMTFSHFKAARFRALGLLAALLAAGPALAGSIYGNLKRGAQPLGGVALKLVCGASQASGQSDAQGNYTLVIAGSGRCALMVGDKAFPVVLGEDAARYDFDVPADNAPLRRR